MVPRGDRDAFNYSRRGHAGKGNREWKKVEQSPAMRAAMAKYVGPDSKEYEIGKKLCLWWALLARAHVLC